MKREASFNLSGEALEQLKTNTMETLDSYIDSLVAEAEKRG